MEDKLYNLLNKVAMSILGFLARSSLKSCLRDVKSKDSEKRLRAVDQLGRLCDFPVRVPLRPLVFALQDEDSRVRTQAARSLAWLGYANAALPFLLKALKDSDSEVRGSVVYALRTQPAALPDLIKMLEDEDSGVRKYAVEAIANLGGKKSFSLLMKTLQDESVQVRHYTALSLGLYGGEDAIPALELVQKNDTAKIWEGVKGKEAYRHVTVGDVARTAIERILERKQKSAETD